MLLIVYVALGTAFAAFIHSFTIRQFPIHNSSALSNVVTAFVMWPVQAIFLIIASTAFTKFGAKKAIEKAITLMANCYIANMNAIICAFVLCMSFIAMTLINHFRASNFEQHFQLQCGAHIGARLALLIMLVQLLFLIRIVVIGARSHRQIAGSIQADFRKLMKG